jgi:hypothetical protein
MIVSPERLGLENDCAGDYSLDDNSLENDMNTIMRNQWPNEY